MVNRTTSTDHPLIEMSIVELFNDSSQSFYYATCTAVGDFNEDGEPQSALWKFGENTTHHSIGTDKFSMWIHIDAIPHVGSLHFIWLGYAQGYLEGGDNKVEEIRNFVGNLLPEYIQQIGRTKRD